MDRPPVILLGVTVDLSLTLMTGFPEYLRDAGWDVHVATSPGDRLDLLSTVPGITAHALPMEREPSPAADLRSLGQWRSLIATTRPDVVTVGTPKAGLLGGIAAMLARVPVRVYVLRGLRLETTTGAQRLVLTALERLSCAVAHEVIAVSPSLRKRALDLRLVPARKIRVLGEGSSNGVDLSRFAPDAVSSEEVAALAAQLGLVPGVPVVGFVGRLSADKGLGMLARARQLLAARGVDHQLLIVGPVEGGDSDELRGAGRPPIEPGYVPDPARYYQLIDVLCLPTYREGFPNVVLEAAAAGVPTVTTDATGAVDSVVDGVTGFAIPVDDTERLADRLEELVSHPDVRQRMGAAARARVESAFRREIVWANTEAEYRRLYDGVRR